MFYTSVSFVTRRRRRRQEDLFHSAWFLKMKGRLWLTRGLSVLDMKADNELPISLPVLFKSVKVTCDSIDPEDHLNFI